MAFKTITVANTVGITEGETAAIVGKNGFFTVAGSIPVNISGLVEVDSSSNIQFTIDNLDNLFDPNFGEHIFGINDPEFKAVDSTGKGNDAVIANVAFVENTGEFLGAGALRFSGNNTTELVSFSNTILQGVGDCTIEYLYKSNADLTSGANLSTILSGLRVGVGNEVHVNHNQGHISFINQENQRFIQFNGNNFQDGNTRRFSITRNIAGDVITVYVDGELLGTNNSFGTTYSIDSDLLLGQDYDSLAGDFDPNQALRGTIDDFRIWNKALTQDEIEDNAKKELSGVESNLRVYYKFNNPFFDGIKGNDFIGFQVEEKANAGGQENFVGHRPTTVQYSSEILNFDLSSNTVKIKNEGFQEAAPLFDKITTPPNKGLIGQIIDTRFFNAKNIFVEGSTIVRERLLNVVGISGSFSAELGVVPNNKKEITIFIDGINITETNFSWTPGSNTVIIALSGQDQEVKTSVSHYTVPAIEPGDQISFFSENTYLVSNTSYSIEDPKYNAALTANNFFQITLTSNLTSNLSLATAVNISPDLQGTIGNVNNQSNTFTIDFNEASFSGNFNLANNKIYTVLAPIDFRLIQIGQDRIIRDVPVGLNIVKARNKNSFGRLSPESTDSVTVGKIPIQRVVQLEANEFLLKDTTQGVSVNIEISFQHITGQDVTDYQLSWRPITSGLGTLAFKTVKLPASGVDVDGFMRYTLFNVDRGGGIAVNSILIRVVALNRTIKGIPAELIHTVIGKSAPPLNVVELTGGQQDSNVLLSWRFPQDATGTQIDLDLLETTVRSFPGRIEPSLFDVIWPTARRVEEVGVPSTTLLFPILQFATTTYLVKTKDTSKNESSNAVGITLDLVKPANLIPFKIYSEDDPGGNTFPGLPNDNAGETEWPSFNDSTNGGLSGPGTSAVDNANGTSSGWAVISGAPTDITATGQTAFYQTQVRDVGSLVTGRVSIISNSVIGTKSTFNDLHSVILSGVNESTSDPTILEESDFGGIGHVLGFNNANAASVSYKAECGTLNSGGPLGNVYAIINPGQFVDDISNANSFALIAGVIDDNTIKLGNTFFANGRPTGSNSAANTADKSSSFNLVNLEQFGDATGLLNFLGQDSIIESNLEIRISVNDPFYANSNVDSNVFVGGNINEGWRPYTAAESDFRWFQIRFNLNNKNPAVASFIFDQFRTVVDLKVKEFSDDVTVSGNPTAVDYTATKFARTPSIKLAMLTDGDFSPAIVDKTKTGANIRVYQSGSPVTNTSVDFSATGI